MSSKDIYDPLKDDEESEEEFLTEPVDEDGY